MIKENIKREKEGTKVRNRNIAIILLIIVIFSISQFIIVADRKNENNATYNHSLNITSKTNLSDMNLTEEDKEFIKWFSLKYAPIKNDLDCIVDAAKTEDFNKTQLCGKLLKEDSQRPLNEIDRFNTSISMKEVFLVYKKSLENYNIGGRNLEIGAKNHDISLMDNASTYIKEGNVHISLSYEFINKK